MNPRRLHRPTTFSIRSDPLPAPLGSSGLVSGAPVVTSSSDIEEHGTGSPGDGSPFGRPLSAPFRGSDGGSLPTAWHGARHGDARQRISCPALGKAGCGREEPKADDKTRRVVAGRVDHVDCGRLGATAIRPRGGRRPIPQCGGRSTCAIRECGFLRIGGGYDPGRAGGGHGCHPQRKWLLIGGLRRGHLRIRERSFSGIDRWTTSGRSDCVHRRRPRRPGLLAIAGPATPSDRRAFAGRAGDLQLGGHPRRCVSEGRQGCGVDLRRWPLARLHTPDLQILTQYHVPATFQIIGYEGAARPDLLKLEVSDGMPLTNHTWDHADLATLSPAAFPGEVDATTNLTTSVTGQPVKCLRPPGGATNGSVLSQLSQRGLGELLWDVDPSDYLRPGAGVIRSE